MRTRFYRIGLLLPFFCFGSFCSSAQDIEDPSARIPYRIVVQTGIALQWFDEQFKCFTLSAEKPLNLYNHVGMQANFFFPNDNYNYRNVTGKSYEVGVFAKCFLHGRLTGRRSKTYLGPDMRWGSRVYQSVGGAFSNEIIETRASTFKFMCRIGWQYHFGPAVLELALPFGIEKESFKDENVNTGSFYYYYSDSSRFVASPLFSLGIGF